VTGRCAGCGLTDRNADKVREHARYCPEYKTLYQESPERALDPEAEFTRYKEAERAGDRQVRREAAVTEAERRRAVQTARWETPPDLLSES